MKKSLFILAAVAMVAAGLSASGQSIPKRDYIDEYGINHGKGVEIEGAVWAPVNCGYHATMYPYGKLYQWGRKVGQGYGYPNGVDKQGENNVHADTKGSKVKFVIEPPATLAFGQSKESENIFYYVTKSSPHWFNWIGDDMVHWNIGNKYDAVKNPKDDPCPKGWRVPSCEDMSYLIKYHSDECETDKHGIPGMWFSGMVRYSPSAPRIFLPLAGMRAWNNGESSGRDSVGYYWSSACGNSVEIYSDGGVKTRMMEYPAEAYSVRCVQE